MKILFRAYFHQKKFLERSWPKVYQGQDPDPDVFESTIWIRSKFVRIRNTVNNNGMAHRFWGIVFLAMLSRRMNLGCFRN
jgi:hypothetical protein